MNLIEMYTTKSFFNIQISIAPIRIFVHLGGENISGYFKTSDPLIFISSEKFLLTLKIFHNLYKSLKLRLQFQ